MPLDVAVEEPHARVVGAEAQRDVAVGVNEDGVAAHGDRWVRGCGCVVEEHRLVVRVVEAGGFGGSGDELEVVRVQVEGVLAGVVVVHDDLDDLAVLEDEGVRVDAVDARVGDYLGGRGEDGVECWDFLVDVGDVVEECAGDDDESLSFLSRQCKREQ